MSTTISRFDLDDLYNWEEIHTTYDDNGIIEARSKLLDSGVSIENSFINGIRHSKFQEDNSTDGSAVNWQYIDSNYDTNGQLNYRSFLYDNDVTRQEGFNNGVRTYIAQQDNSVDGSAKNWQNTESIFDANGQVSSKLTLFDTDVYKGEVFENGARVFTLQEDRSANGDAVKWQTIETAYDVNGDLSSRTTVYDVDVTKAEYFENGVRRFTSEVDQSADGSAKKWQTKDTEYNENGTLATQTIEYDSGLRDFVAYENGSKVFRLQEDNSADGSTANWQSIETIYDENGKPGYQQTLYDNDIEKSVVYHDGAKLNVTKTDNSTDGSAAIWQNKSSDYDASGTIQSSQTLFDNDVFEFISYANGVRLQRNQTDQSTDGSAKNWQSLITQYDENGVIERTNILYDDDDSMISLYESGNINARLKIDGDESEIWAAKEVRYDQNGSVSDTIFYDSLDDIPLEFYGELFI